MSMGATHEMRTASPQDSMTGTRGAKGGTGTGTQYGGVRRTADGTPQNPGLMHVKTRGSGQDEDEEEDDDVASPHHAGFNMYDGSQATVQEDATS